MHIRETNFIFMTFRLLYDHKRHTSSASVSSDFMALYKCCYYYYYYHYYMTSQQLNLVYRVVTATDRDKLIV